MVKQNSLQNLDNFNKSMEDISQLRYEAMDKIDALNAQVVEYAKENEVPDAVWRSIGLEYFQSHRYEQSVEAYLKSIEATKKLNSDEQNYIVGIYGDLSMVYEHMGKYSEAAKALEDSLSYTTDTSKKESISKKIEKLKRLESAS